MKKEKKIGMVFWPSVWMEQLEAKTAGYVDLITNSMIEPSALLGCSSIMKFWTLSPVRKQMIIINMIGPAVGFESLQPCWVCIPAGIRVTSIIRFDSIPQLFCTGALCLMPINKPTGWSLLLHSCYFAWSMVKILNVTLNIQRKPVVRATLADP